MTISHRAALSLLILLLAHAAVAVPSVAQAATDTDPATPVPTAAESLRALQLENDSLHTALEERNASVLARAGDVAQSMSLRLFGAIVVLVLTYFVVRGVGYVIESLAEQNPRRRLVLNRLLPLLRILLWTVAVSFVLRGIFDVPAEGLLVAAAVAGLAVGFAAQDLLKDFFGGLVIVFDQPFQVGDRIAVGDTYGEVSAIGLRSTRIATPDDHLVAVPNAQVVNGQVTNANAGALACQVITDLYLPSGVDETKAKKIAYEAAASSAYVFLQKPIVIHVRDVFKGTFLTHLMVNAYVLDARYEALLVTDITERARRAFRAQGFLPPMPDPPPGAEPMNLPHAEGNGQPSSDRHPSPPHSASASE